MRARQPDFTGTLDRDGVEIAYEVFGAAHQNTILLLPTWSVVHSRHWKAQVPVLARHHRVVTFDGRGNGASGRPVGADAYLPEEFAADAIAVLDRTETARAMIAGVSFGGLVALLLAAQHPERIAGACFLGALVPFIEVGVPEMFVGDFDVERDTYDGWELYNRHAYQRDYRRFLEFFFERCFPEPHSTKQRDDAVGWGLETNPSTLTDTSDAHRMSIPPLLGKPIDDLCAAVRCPTLHIHGDQDEVTPHAWAVELAARLGGDLLTVEGGGHLLQAREPVLVNDALLRLADRVLPRAPRHVTWTRALNRPKKVLYLSSPIGLGHARRDLAIARELRAQCDDVQVDWLTQHPVTAFLEGVGESVHPAARHLANESAHIEGEAHEHDLHAFQAIRRMDEILVSNFSVLQEIVDGGEYDLVVGDEAWDVDYFWHENPELKRTAFVWMTDFVGWLPMPDGGAREAELTADYNAEMLEHVERFARIRDRSIFVGAPEDIVPDSFGPGLPSVRDWTERHFDFAGYITGFDPAELADRAELREQLGYPRDTPVVVVTVGGSGVGEALLRKLIDAYPIARKKIDDLQLLVVAGPRIDSRSLPEVEGIDVRGYVPDLQRHLAACDAAIVQGGLTTTMELVATGRPFLYFPLHNHFEQQRHVRHRLERHRAGRCMTFADSDPDTIADALADELARDLNYLPVPTDGASRAATLIAELL
ncbi:MAG: hypothetical protein QOI95_702 [Acidimicrobiaceae bacterium]|jgi:pimeloyl-ACP methyl ester carboxylesterase/predicted glycosyltransferase